MLKQIKLPECWIEHCVHFAHSYNHCFSDSVCDSIALSLSLYLSLIGWWQRVRCVCVWLLVRWEHIAHRNDFHTIGTSISDRCIVSSVCHLHWFSAEAKFSSYRFTHFASSIVGEAFFWISMRKTLIYVTQYLLRSWIIYINFHLFFIRIVVCGIVVFLLLLLLLLTVASSFTSHFFLLCGFGL